MQEAPPKQYKMVVTAEGRLQKVFLDETPKVKVGRKPLPDGARRKMYSTRLHPKTISQLEQLRISRGKPISRVIEDLVAEAASES
jgi:hypothetical protein